MSLTTKQRQQLKGQAHKLKPIIWIGNKGLTAAVHKEIDFALHDHELIKIRIPVQDRALRQQLAEEIATTNKAELIQLIGNIGIFYRLNPEK